MSQRIKKFVLNRAGVRELLRSSEVMDLVEAEAASRCPTGCVVNTYVGRNRVNARIVTDSEAAYRDNLDNNTLLISISS